MKWILIKGLHINTDHVQTFQWIGGRLMVGLAEKDVLKIFDDPDKKLYIRMCHLLGVRPAEEDPSGKG